MRKWDGMHPELGMNTTVFKLNTLEF